MLTAERLREVLDYDPVTGVFHWRVSPRQNVKAGSVAGHCQADGYWRVRIDRRAYLAHRLVWLYVHGEWPPAMIDHRHGERSTARLDELRPATRSQNLANAKLSKVNTSGFKGVSWHKRQRAWVAQIGKAENGKRRNYHLGYFADPKQAHEAYVAKARELFGEFARAA